MINQLIYGQLVLLPFYYYVDISLLIINIQKGKLRDKLYKTLFLLKAKFGINILLKREPLLKDYFIKGLKKGIVLKKYWNILGLKKWIKSRIKEEIQKMLINLDIILLKMISYCYLIVIFYIIIEELNSYFF